MVISPRHVTIDTNAAAVIAANGSVLGLWRDHTGIKLPKGHQSRPHTFRAAHWRDPASYIWDTTDLFSPAEVPGALEDPTIWIRASSGDQDSFSYHALFHMQYDCPNCGVHAFSLDGLNWTATGIAYTAGELDLLFVLIKLAP